MKKKWITAEEADFLYSLLIIVTAEAFIVTTAFVLLEKLCGF